MFLLCDVIGPLQDLVSEPKMKTIPILEWYGDTLPPTISTPHKGNKAPENFPNHLQNRMHCDVPHEICHACYKCRYRAQGEGVKCTPCHCSNSIT
jgi:hypothetical protein